MTPVEAFLVVVAATALFLLVGFIASLAPTTTPTPLDDLREP